MFRREDDIHAGSAGRCHAAADGDEPSANAAHEDRHPVPRHVPEAQRICHEHHAKADHQAGAVNFWKILKLLEINYFA